MSTRCYRSVERASWGELQGVCPLHGDRTRGLAPFVGIGEAGFRAEPMTGCPFNPGRRLHTALRAYRL